MTAFFLLHPRFATVSHQMAASSSGMHGAVLALQNVVVLQVARCSSHCKRHNSVSMQHSA